jgi:hypothetical protein
LAITFGPNQDRRPDPKQLVFILTVTDDGGYRCNSAPKAATPPTTRPTARRPLASAAYLTKGTDSRKAPCRLQIQENPQNQASQPW